MKCLEKCMMAVMIIFTATGSYAQATAYAGSTGMIAEAKMPAPAAEAKDITLMVKNDSEKHIWIFAGCRKQVFDGKGQTVGALSTNTLYLKEGDVVCIMNDPKTIQACAIAKDGLSKVEINKSGNGFVK